MKKAGTLLLTLAMLLTLVPVQALAAGGSEAYGTEEIGRASCRERVS